MTTLGLNLETKSIVNSVIKINRRGRRAVQRNENSGLYKEPGREARILFQSQESVPWRSKQKLLQDTE